MTDPTQRPTDELAITLAETARRLSVSYSTVQRLIYAGELRTIRVGSRGVRVLVRSIEEYLRRQADREAALLRVRIVDDLIDDELAARQAAGIR